MKTIVAVALAAFGIFTALPAAHADELKCFAPIIPGVYNCIVVHSDGVPPAFGSYPNERCNKSDDRTGPALPFIGR